MTIEIVNVTINTPVVEVVDVTINLSGIQTVTISVDDTASNTAAISALETANAVTAWTALPWFLLAPWRNFGPGGYQVAQYRKVGDRVSVRGVIDSNGTAVGVGSAEWVADFPVGFRVPANHVTTGYCHSATQGRHVARMILQTNGLLVIDSAVTTGAITYLSFDFEFSTIA